MRGSVRQLVVVKIVEHLNTGRWRQSCQRTENSHTERERNSEYIPKSIHCTSSDLRTNRWPVAGAGPYLRSTGATA